MELIEVIKDYQNRFAGKSCLVSTSYKQLEQFIVAFELSDIHHLVGLHKVTKDFANITLPKIQKKELTLEIIKDHANFTDVISRIECYNILDKIFYKGEVNICIVKKDFTSNTMNLDVIFFKEKERLAIVLGLRKTKDGIYKPVTMHLAKKRKFLALRKTLVKSITWI
ncbi:PBECR4 domain-containing protein [Streptococcus dysgalactiae]